MPDLNGSTTKATEDAAFVERRGNTLLSINRWARTEREFASVPSSEDAREGPLVRGRARASVECAMIVGGVRP